MPLEAGTRLGPYEIVAPLGAGGMGEVYRARDPRLGREVAVKVLPPAFARDRERLQRFEHEARAAGALNHPGITAIFDLGTQDGIPFLVSELLEGQSLRDVLAEGPLPPARVADLGIQTAQALAAAHAKGIVHRDLKPENLHLLPDGRLKVLDFGLAKLTATDAPARDETGPQLHSITMTGTILGTASYMAPEQVRDQPVDHRADLFALGAILFELASGRRAFPGETPADRMTAILTRDPDPLPSSVDAAIPGLEAVIRRCLEKRASDRFDSARDLAFTLRLLVAAQEKGGPAAPKRAEAAVAPRDVRFRQLTFREGLVSGARFASGGRTVVYAANWGADEKDLYLAPVGSHEHRPLNVPGARVLSISRSDELLVRLRSRDVGGFVVLGVIARMPLMGGTPREVADEVFQATFGPDGRQIAAVRFLSGAARLEYPLGTVLAETNGWFSSPCVLPDGRVFCVDHPARGDNAGYPMIVGREGGQRLTTERFSSVAGGVLLPGGRHVLMSGQEADGSGGIFFVSLEGGYRPAYRTPDWSFVEDVSDAGDVLLTRRSPRMLLETGTRGQDPSRDLSWLDWSLARDLTSDGRTVLFDETGLGAGHPTVFVRGTDGSPPVPIADGDGVRLSPDGRTAMVIDPTNPTGFELVPIGIGSAESHRIAPVRGMGAAWFPDGKAICIGGHEPQGRPRLYRYDLATRVLRPLTEEGTFISFCSVSPDGAFVFILSPRGHSIYPVAGGEPHVLEALGSQHRGIGWSPDGSAVFAFERGRVPTPVLRIDLASGRAEPWMEIHPRSTGGVTGSNAVWLSADGERYVCSYSRTLSELFLVTGLTP